MNLADFSTQEIVNIMAALTEELAARSGSYAAPPPEDPATSLMRQLAQRGPQAPRTLGQRPPPMTRPPIGSNAAPQAPMATTMAPPLPGTVIATARTDPAAAQAMMATSNRLDGQRGINGNGVGMGGEVDAF